jgi:hypothetical protein
MSDLKSEIVKILCTGLGEGNMNTGKLTKQIVAQDPDRNFNQTKIEVVEALRDLVESGQIQIVTTGWEFGEEFLFICSRRL